MECFKRILATAIIALLSTASIAQITSGKIIYERRTNLKKTVGDNPRIKDYITDENKIRKENFELIFNENSSVFSYIEEGEATDEPGFMKMLTQRNKVYQNLEEQEFFIIMNSWGQEMLMKDSLSQRKWKITENKRKFAGHMCRKAIWEQNDSTRIYAWFSPDIVPSVGPEGFYGLPGAILGLATENGAIVYFATEIEEAAVDKTKMDYSAYKKDVFTKNELIETLVTSMGKWMKREDLEGMFSWY
jgi:GLPGLI family protein